MAKWFEQNRNNKWQTLYWIHQKRICYYKLEMPVIFINGECDNLVPIKYLDGIKEILPNAKVYILQSCKHWSVKEKPEEFFNIV